MLLSVIVIAVLFKSGLGKDLKEIWIRTKDTGNIDAYTHSNINLNYTNLRKYGLIDQITSRTIHFKVKTCHDAFVLLSTSEDLSSSEYYELVIGSYGNTAIALNRETPTIPENLVSSPDIVSCTGFGHFKLSWSENGDIYLWKWIMDDFQNVFTFLMTRLISIRGIGIRSGYGAMGIWIFDYEATFTGHYCGKQETKGDMQLLEDVAGLSEIACAGRCNLDDRCLGFNINSSQNKCQLIAEKQYIDEQSDVEWQFYTKCFNDRQLCLSCLP